jgi:hypothetical protein
VADAVLVAAGGSISCGPITIAPGGVDTSDLQQLYDYPADIDNGSFSNTAALKPVESAIRMAIQSDPTDDAGYLQMSVQPE